MHELGASDEDEMVACFLSAELASERWGEGVRGALAATERGERLVTHADVTDAEENLARREILGMTRGYDRNLGVFEDFPTEVEWRWAMLEPEDLIKVRYIEYSYWNELSGGSRLAVDAAGRIEAGVMVFDVANDRFSEAAASLAFGDPFPPLIIVGSTRTPPVCLEGNLRLTAYALAGFPGAVKCLVGESADAAVAPWAR